MKMLSKIQEDMNESKESLNIRLEKLEAQQPVNMGNADAQPNTSTQRQPETVHRVEVAAGREKSLTKEFGVVTSASTLLEFLDHYKLCCEINQEKKVPGWDRADYRAKELRCQLQGEAGTFVRQEEAMHEQWVFDDNQIIEKLKERWLNRDCIELDIIDFEEARQGDAETLAQYMTRLKGLGQMAFSEFDPRGMQQRIIWRFLDGLRDKDIRASIIRERWMKDRKTPKSYDEVLKIAENARMVKVAASATGSGGPSPKAAIAGSANVGSFTRGGNTRRGMQRGIGARSNPPPRGFDCFYCHQRHPGGWKSCDKRRRENPTWEPRHKSTSGYGSSSSSNPTSPTIPRNNSSPSSGSDTKFFSNSSF